MTDFKSKQWLNSNPPDLTGEPEFEPEMKLSEAIDEFMLMAKVDGRSESTKDLYKYTFKKFKNDVNEDTSIGDISTKDIRLFLESLIDGDLAKTTVSIHYRNLHAFFNWLLKERFLPENPVAPIEKPKTPNTYPKHLSEEDVRALLDAEKKRNTWAAKRNYTMLLLFVDTGIRRNELRNAKIDDLDLQDHSLKVHGKGAKDRTIFYGTKTARYLHKWLRIRKKLDDIFDDTIFIDQNGKRIEERHIGRIITRIQRRAGLEDKQISPHVLRHTAATLAVQNGLDPFSLKQQFGWENLETAQRYVHMAGDKVGEAYRESSPLSNIAG